MKNTKAILTDVYPKMSQAVIKNKNKYKAVLQRFINNRSESLYDTAPCDRIFFGDDDINDYFKSLDVSKDDIKTAISKTYYHQIASFNPRAAKDEFTVAQMCVIRYYYLNNMKKELEISSIYLAFSGKFYPSIHYSSYPTVTPSEHRYVMDYVVNNLLSAKFDIKSQGSVFGAIKSICDTWIKSYGNRFKSFDDEDLVYLIQQLHNRIKSFMHNIAEIYYDAYKNKGSYLTYDSDNYSDSDYHLADNDSLKAERLVEKTLELSNSVDYLLCKRSSDSNVRVDEVKSIIETIIEDPKNQADIRELIRLMIYTYFAQSETKDVRDISFITFTISAKPNSKDKDIIRQKEIVEKWLDEGSPSYRKRRSRLATKNSYHKSVFTYFALLINKAAM